MKWFSRKDQMSTNHRENRLNDLEPRLRRVPDNSEWPEIADGIATDLRLYRNSFYSAFLTRHPITSGNTTLSGLSKIILIVCQLRGWHGFDGWSGFSKEIGDFRNLLTKTICGSDYEDYISYDSNSHHRYRSRFSDGSANVPDYDSLYANEFIDYITGRTATSEFSEPVHQATMFLIMFFPVLSQTAELSMARRFFRDPDSIAEATRRMNIDVVRSLCPAALSGIGLD